MLKPNSIICIVVMCMLIIPMYLSLTIEDVKAKDEVITLSLWSHYKWQNEGWPDKDTAPIGTTYLEIVRDDGTVHTAGFFDNREYKGKPYTPKVYVYTIVEKGQYEVVLVENRDYTVTYKNNTNVGTAQVIIKGIGEYQGTITETFEISHHWYDGSIKLKKWSVGMNSKGKVQRPKITMTYAGNNLITGKDYTVKFTNYKKKHWGKAKISFKGNFAGDSVTKYYGIQPDKPKVKIKTKKLKKNYTGFIIKTKNRVPVNDVQICIYKDKKCRKLVKTSGLIWRKGIKRGFERKNCTFKAKTKLKNGTYYIRVRTVGFPDMPATIIKNAKSVYSPYSKPIKVKVR